MQARASLADVGDERLLDGHVDVLVVDIELEFARIDALLDAIEPRNDGLDVRGADDALCAEHARMRLRPGDVLSIQLLVNGQRRAETLRELRDVFREPA